MFRITVAAVFASGRAAADPDINGFSLLQTSAHMQSTVSVHSGRDTKECKAAKKLRRSTKKQYKIDRDAYKKARDAFRAAKETMSSSKQADEGALAAETSACPVPEPDQSPDVGCSTDLFTSYDPKDTRGAYHFLKRGLPTPGFMGFQKVEAGPGAEPAGGKKLGLAVMQPCSMAWTSGSYEPGHGIDHVTGKYANQYTKTQAFLKKTGLKTSCECREWAETVMPWPKGVAVTFNGGLPHSPLTICQVWGRVDPDEYPWHRGGFSLVLKDAGDGVASCYLGNPEEWNYRVQAAKDAVAPQIIDKCSKDYWASGHFDRVENRNPVHVGDLMAPDPEADTVEGRKMCLKWVRADARCKDAVAIALRKISNKGNCECWLSVRSTGGYGGRAAGDHPDYTTCLL